MLVLGLTAFASLPVTEGNYLHEDSLIWHRLDSISGRIWKEIDNACLHIISLTAGTAYCIKAWAMNFPGTRWRPASV